MDYNEFGDVTIKDVRFYRQQHPYSDLDYDHFWESEQIEKMEGFSVRILLFPPVDKYGNVFGWWAWIALGQHPQNHNVAALHLFVDVTMYYQAENAIERAKEVLLSPGSWRDQMFLDAKNWKHVQEKKRE